MLNGEGWGGAADNPRTEFISGQPEPFRVGLPNYWINTASRNLVIQDRIYRYKGLGPAVECTLTFNSLGIRRGMFGLNWSFSHESSLETDKDEIRMIRGSGQVVRYRRSSSPGTAQAPVELAPLTGSSDRLLDYGSFWLYIPWRSRTMFRYESPAGSTKASLVSIADYDGNAVSFAYNPDGSLTQIVDAAGRATAFGYAAPDGLCTSLRIPDGREARFSYDTQHRLVRVTDLAGIVTEYTYGTDNALSRMVVGEDRKTTEFTYGQGGHVAAVRDAAGTITRYEAAGGSEVRVTDPEGTITTYRSVAGRTEKIIDPLGAAIEYTYASGFRVGTRNRNGAQVRRDFDARGNVTRITDPAGNSTFFEYDAYDNPVRRRDALGGILTYAYDDRQHLVRMVTPGGRAFRWDYDQKGQLSSTTDPSGNVTTMEYDRFGNLAAVRDPAGSRYELRYDPSGLRIAGVVHPDGGVYGYEYDGNDRVRAVHHPDGTTTRYRHGCCAPLAVTDEKGGTVSYARNPLLFVLERTDALGNKTQYTYNRNNALTGITDPLGRCTAFHYDAAGRVIRSVDPAGNATDLTYDAAGNLVALTDPRGSVTMFRYDAANQRTGITDSLRHTTQFGRDPLGRLTRMVNARGMAVEYRYDADGHLIEKLHGGNRVAAYGYTPNGNPATVEDADGSTQFACDARGRVTRIVYPDGISAEFSYNEEGNAREIRYPGDLAVTITYDLCGRVTRIAWGGHFYARSYDATGCVIREIRSNGAESIYEYDPTGLFTRIRHTGRSGTIADLFYRWDAAGNVIEETGVLPGTPSAAPAEPARAVYSTENQVISWGMRQFRYDDDGNRIAAEGDALTFSAKYDAENRPTGIRTSRQSLQFSYNGMGDLAAIRSGGGEIRNHYTPEGRLMVQTDGNGSVLRSFLYCEGRLIAMVQPGGDTLFYHFDKTGNTLALTDSAGNTVAEYTYDVYGAVTGRDGDDRSNPFTYAGEYGVMEIGDDLFFMRHRFYDAATGSFVQKDPIGHLGGTNLYGYVGGNPVARVDPEGTDLGFCLLLVTVAIAGYLTYCSANKFGEQNPLTRVLKVAPQGNPEANKRALGPDPKGEFFNDPDHGMTQVMTTAGDQALTANPLTNPGWSMIKAGQSLADGKPVDAALNTLSAFPDGVKVVTGTEKIIKFYDGRLITTIPRYTEVPVGSLFTAGGQVKSMCTEPPPGR